jgi:hypothetical protein
MGDLNSFSQATVKYRPAAVRILFVAEAPSAYESKRFFYFTGLQRQDTLFLEMMKNLPSLKANPIGEAHHGITGSY